MLQIVKLTKGSNLYAILIALLPILALYKDLFNLAEIGTVFLLISGVLLLITNFGQLMKRKCAGYGWLALFIINAILSVFFWGNYDSATYSRTAILTVIIMAFCVLVHVGYSNTKIFSVRRASSFVQTVSLVAAVLVLIQLASYYLFGFYINVIVKPLLLDYIQNDYMSFIQTGISKEGMFRPSAFFLEPSHMSLYCLVGVVTLLFNNTFKNRIIKAVIISIGIIFTTSGIGIFLLIVVWTIWLFISKVSKNKSLFISRLIKILIGVFSLVIIFILLSQVPALRDAYYRINSDSLGTSAIYPRIYNLLFFFEEGKSLQIMGNGFLTYPISYYKYYNGAIKLLYGQGYIGLGLFIAFLWTRFRISNSCNKILIIIFAGLFIVAEMYSTIYLCYYLMFICTDEKFDNLQSCNSNKLNFKRNLLFSPQK